MEEIWKDVIGYEDSYQISNKGILKSKDRDIVKNNGVIQHRKGINIAITLNSDGYAQAKLCKNGTMRTIKIHRLVAEHFIENPRNLPEVNHKDYDRNNNNVENLEWSTHKDNIVHSAKAGHYKHYGENNSNYKNTTLKNYYSTHPQEKEKLARANGQNGRAKKIKLTYCASEKIFNCIKECAEFCVANIHVFQKYKLKSAISVISKSANSNIPYKDIIFKFL